MAGEQWPPAKSQLEGLPGYHPYDMQSWLISVSAVAVALGFVSVALRLLSRLMHSQKLWWDDYMVVFSGCWSLVVLGFMFVMHSHGLGIHADVVYPGNITRMLQWLLISEVFYVWSLAWTKISILLLYYRIFHVAYFKQATLILGLVVVAWVLCITFVFVFTCIPVEKFWSPHLQGYCINQVGTWVANAASTLITDVVILLLPIYQIRKLQLKKAAKIGLYCTFGLGFFVVFASAYRTKVLLLYDSSDPTYTLGPTVGWTAIEMSAGVVSVNLPTVLPLLGSTVRRLLPKSPIDQSVAGTHLRGNIPSRPTQTAQRNRTTTRRAETALLYELPDGITGHNKNKFVFDACVLPVHIGDRRGTENWVYRCFVTGQGLTSTGDKDDTDEAVPLKVRGSSYI